MELLNREISILRLLIEEKNITRAAERAGLQQPAVSKILNQLEKKVERRLFLRTSAGLKPSVFALELNRLACEMKTSWSKSINRLLEKESGIEGTFFIGCHSIVAKSYLARTFVSLLNQYPHLHLNLILEPSRSITQRVAKGEIHFGLVANPIKHPELISKPMGQEHVYLYTNGTTKKNSVLYYNPEMIDVERFTRQFKNYKLVAIADYQLILAFLKEKENQSAILPSFLGENEQRLKVASKSFYKTDIKLIYRQDLYKSPACEIILEELRKLRKD